MTPWTATSFCNRESSCLGGEQPGIVHVTLALNFENMGRPRSSRAGLKRPRVLNASQVALISAAEPGLTMTSQSETRPLLPTVKSTSTIPCCRFSSASAGYSSSKGWVPAAVGAAPPKIKAATKCNGPIDVPARMQETDTEAKCPQRVAIRSIELSVTLRAVPSR